MRTDGRIYLVVIFRGPKGGQLYLPDGKLPSVCLNADGPDASVLAERFLSERGVPARKAPRLVRSGSQLAMPHWASQKVGVPHDWLPIRYIPTMSDDTKQLVQATLEYMYGV